MPARDRFVEVLADRGVGARPRWTVGSGFLIGGRNVLTSAHVVEAVVETGTVSVRRSGDEPGAPKTTWPARVRLLGDVNLADLALVELIGDPGELPLVSYARIDRNTPTTAVVQGCTVVGYPEFKKIGKKAAAVRDTVQIDGHIPTSEDLASGLLSLRVQLPAPRPLPRQDEALGMTPWSGISGAAAVVDGRVVGVVSEHHPRAGASALTLVPITFIDRLPDAALWWATLGADPAQLRLLPPPVPCLIGSLPAAAEHYQRRGFDDDLQSALASSAVVVLSPERVGLGGVGITQLAGTTARRLWESQDIDVLVWVRADERDRVVKGYEEAATVVGADDFLSWLARTERRWLVVFDDFTDPAQLSGLWPPAVQSGRVLVCARDWRATPGQEDGMRGLIRRIEVGPFRPDEATAYVMANLDCTLEEAADLSRTLRFQPMALAEATSYIRVHPVDCRQYLERFAERQQRLPKVLLGGSGQADVQRSAVTVAWSLGVERRDPSGGPARGSRAVYQMTSGPDGTLTQTLNVDGAFTRLLVERLDRLGRFPFPEGGPGDG